MKGSRGFTVMELSVVVVIVFVLGAALFVALGGVASSASYATEEAKEYVSRMYPGWSVVGIAPMDRDTDGDGYVSVDVRVKSPKGEEKMLYLSCARWAPLQWNRGAKERPMMPGTGAR